MSIIIANIWKSRASLKQFNFHQKIIVNQTMSTDRKRTGQENNSKNDEGE